MSDPPRLFAGEANEFERELLESWGAEQPSAEARARILAIAPPAVLAGSLAAKAGTVAGSVAPKGAVGIGLLKWLAIGGVGAAAAVAGMSLGYLRHADRAASSFDPPVVQAPAATVTEPPPAPTASGAVVASPAPPARASAAPAARRTERAPHVMTDDALGEQVTALDRARHTLSDGDAAGALRQLDDYESRFARGALVEEAEVLRVEALLVENDRAAASRVGSRFLAAHPSSPHAARIRALLGQPGADR